MVSRAPHPRRSLRTARLLLTLALSTFAGLALPGCGDPSLRKVSAPRGGIALAYDLVPKAAYSGKVAVGVTRQIDGVEKPLRQAITGDVTMVVLGESPEGGTRVRVTLTSGDLDWALLPSSGYARDQFLKMAAKYLKGLHMPMTIGPRGGVLERPSPPADAPDEVVEVIDAVIDAVALSFVSVPDKKLSRGDRWTPAGAGRMESRYRGLFRHEERDEDVARFELAITSAPIGPDDQGERQGTLVALFATAGYPASIDLEARDFDPTLGMSFRRIQVEWTKGGVAPIDLAVPRDEGPQDVQVITDPCNPDYVGPRMCDDDEPDVDDDELDDDEPDDDDDR
jgi:hypothetical protein